MSCGVFPVSCAAYGGLCLRANIRRLLLLSQERPFYADVVASIMNTRERDKETDRQTDGQTDERER